MAPNGADNDTKRMLFPMSDVKGLPLTENIKGSALFYKNGFIMPKLTCILKVGTCMFLL